MRSDTICAVYYCILPETAAVGSDLHIYQKKLALRMLRQVFSDFFHVELKEEKIKRHPNGKPYYEDNENFQFNISHCRTAVVVAVSGRCLGIDVESSRSVKYRTAEKCCNAGEMQYIFRQNPTDRNRSDELSVEETERFLQLWTLKESYVKMTGDGLRTPVNTVCFHLTDFQKSGDGHMRRSVTDEMSTSCLYLPGDITIALTIQGKIRDEDTILWKDRTQMLLE